MSNPRSEQKIFNPKIFGKTLREVAVDYIEVENKKVTSKWLKSEHDADLFLWLDESQKIIKQQLSLFGRVVEWNLLEGVKTGVIIESEFEANKSSEAIEFDQYPHDYTIQLAVQVIEYAIHLAEKERDEVISNFLAPRVKLIAPDSSQGFFKRVPYLIRKFFS